MNDALPKQAVLVVNAMSRNGEAAFERARTMLEERGVELIEAHAITRPDDMQPTVRKALANKAPMIIVGGGDGSLRQQLAGRAPGRHLGADGVHPGRPYRSGTAGGRSVAGAGEDDGHRHRPDFQRRTLGAGAWRAVSDVSRHDWRVIALAGPSDTFAAFV